MRDAIVRPIEDQIAGAPDLQAIETAIQPGQATIVAGFALNSDQNNDLVQVQGRVQNAQRQLPSDLQTPHDHDLRSEPSRRRLAVRRNPHARRRRALGARDQQDRSGDRTGPRHLVRRGQRRRHARRFRSTSARARLSASGFTLTDVVSAISEQQRARAGRHRLRAQSRDERSTSAATCRRPQSVAELLLGTSSGAVVGRFDQFVRNVEPLAARRRRRQRDRRLRTAARLRYTITARRAIALDVQKAANTSEVEASQAVLDRAAETCATVSRRAVHGAERPGDLHAGAAVRRRCARSSRRSSSPASSCCSSCGSWRNAIVVMIAIPASLLVTLAAMQLAELHARHGFAARHDADHRHPRRRLDRRAREHRAPRRRGRIPQVAAYQRARRDRHGGHRHHARRRRRLLADLVLARRRRPVSCASSGWSCRSRR